jgi:hypothetical protein
MTHSRSTRISDIHELQTRFEQWRQSRQKKGPIPDELWAAAVTLALRVGISRTAAALHLDGGKLKRQMAGSAIPNQRTPPSFVELVAPGGSGRAEYTFELESGNGKLRIHCQGATAVELAALSRALWEVAR